MRKQKDFKRLRFKVFNRARFKKMVKQMEYDVKNGDQTTLDSFK